MVQFRSQHDDEAEVVDEWLVVDRIVDAKMFRCAIYNLSDLESWVKRSAYGRCKFITKFSVLQQLVLCM